MTEQLEYTWTIISSIGALASLYSLVDVVYDYWALGQRTNGRRILAIILMVTEAIRLIIQSTWMTIGAFLVADEANIITNPFIAIVLIMTNFLILVKTLVTIWGRHKIRETPRPGDGRRRSDI